MYKLYLYVQRVYKTACTIVRLERKRKKLQTMFVVFVPRNKYHRFKIL